ncbi:MAG: threonylcarbamoyl-AMP synthase [Erythrobacter sp.]|nr:threonylcarbamoyl-AMP synthase [Erythrobacter sp.]
MRGKNATELVQADTAGIARAARILESGGLVAVPTETVYGLAARADDPQAVAKIFAAKGRPDFNPLIVHVRNLEQADKYARIGSVALALAARFWPGPLTMVLPLRGDAALAPAVTAGLDTVALRVPAHPAMRALLDAVDFPVAAPSANRSGFISPTTAQHVLASLDGRIDAVIDGGATECGLESTIVAPRDFAGDWPGDGPGGGRWVLLRPGPVARGEISALLGPASDIASTRIEAPGQLAQHYSPGKPVRLDALEGEPDEFLIGFGAIAGDCTLSASGDPGEAASHLYDCLHQARASDRPRIAVAPIPDTGIGAAINDRLRRASA